MTILDRSRRTRITSIDGGQIADVLAKQLPSTDDIDPGAWAASASDDAAKTVHEAAVAVRERLDRTGDRAQDIRRDLVRAAADLHLDDRLEGVGQRFRESVMGPAVRTAISRLEEQLPNADRDALDRAYARGHARARTTHLVVGIVAGLTAGAVAAVLLDPARGAERRDRISRKVCGLVTKAGEWARATKPEIAPLEVPATLDVGGSGVPVFDTDTAPGADIASDPVVPGPAVATPSQVAGG